MINKLWHKILCKNNSHDYVILVTTIKSIVICRQCGKILFEIEHANKEIGWGDTAFFDVKAEEIFNMCPHDQPYDDCPDCRH